MSVLVSGLSVLVSGFLCPGFRICLIMISGFGCSRFQGLFSNGLVYHGSRTNIILASNLSSLNIMIYHDLNVGFDVNLVLLIFFCI